MDAVVTILHVIVCIFLVAVVLLQRGKGAQVGAVFGGGAGAAASSRCGYVRLALVCLSTNPSQTDENSSNIGKYKYLAQLVILDYDDMGLVQWVEPGHHCIIMRSLITARPIRPMYSCMSFH